MHRAFMIEELVCCILHHSTWSTRAALGGTCRSLFDCYVAFTYVTLHSLEQLDAFLGEPRWSCRDILLFESNFQPLPTPAFTPFSPVMSEHEGRLGRLPLYCKYVKNLVINESAGDNDRLRRLLDVCDDVTLTTIFCQLRLLLVYAKTVDCSKNALRLLLPSVTTVGLGISVGADTHRAAGRVEFLSPPTLIPFLKPMLAMLGMEMFQYTGCLLPLETSLPFMQTIGHWFDDLKVLSIRGLAIDAATVSRLTCAEQLEILILTLEDSLADPLALTFPRLMTLSINFHSVHAWLVFLRYLHAPLLRTLEQQLDSFEPGCPGLPCTWNLREGMQLIARQFAVLEVFHFNVNYHYLLSTRVEYPFTPFRPLLACNFLLHMFVGTAERIVVTDQDLEAMALQWPYLETLQLGTPFVVEETFPSSLSPCATFAGLEAVARFCKDLTTLQVSVALENAHSQESDSSYQVERVTSTVTRLAIYDCPTYEPESAAKVLHEMFPDLRMFVFMPFPAKATFREVTCNHRSLTIEEIRRAFDSQVE